MIDLKLLREHPEQVRAALMRRDPGFGLAVSTLLERDRAYREHLQTVERLRSVLNSSSEQVAERKRRKEPANDLLAELKQVSQSLKTAEPILRAFEQELDELALALPNPPLDQVPDGDASKNEMVRTWGTPATFDFPPKPHWELGEALGLFDLARGAKVAGSGFPLFLGKGARLVRALQHFMLDLHTSEHGYTEVCPPLLVNADSARGTGQLPDKEGTMYQTGDGWYLVPTAEVPVTNMHRDEILAADGLPLAYVAFTPCFRREAGAHGKDTRGLIRVHQFDKVELVRICKPEESAGELERLLEHAETVLQRLGLPYRVVRLAAGDLGFASAMTYDLEVWAPGIQQWLEVSSASTFADFQARRAMIRYRPTPDARPVPVHTLNASGVAFPRTIIALLEQGQQADGSVRLPEALAAVAGFDRITAP